MKRARVYKKKRARVYNMKIRKQSPLTGKINSLELNITMEQYNQWKYHGMLIQNAMPNLSADEREFLISGTYPGEWDKIMGE